MRIDILTLFPRIFYGPLEESLIGRAIERGLLTVNIRDIRDHSTDKHRKVDDTPYGGGPGMVIKPEPVHDAVESVRDKGSRVVLMCPAGRVLSHKVAEELSKEEHLIIICGRYEGIDDRIGRSIVP